MRCPALWVGLSVLISASSQSCAEKIVAREPGDDAFGGLLRLPEGGVTAGFAELHARVVAIYAVPSAPNADPEVIWETVWPVDASLVWPVHYGAFGYIQGCIGTGPGVPTCVSVAWLSRASGQDRPLAGDIFGYARLVECGAHERCADVTLNSSFVDWQPLIDEARKP